jgi:hypothetical protein
MKAVLRCVSGVAPLFSLSLYFVIFNIFGGNVISHTVILDHAVWPAHAMH